MVTTSVILLGIPYALAFGQEQEIMEREREEGLMREGADSVSLSSISNFSFLKHVILIYADRCCKLAKLVLQEPPHPKAGREASLHYKITDVQIGV